MGGNDGRHWEGFLVPRNASLIAAYERGFPISAAIPKLYAFGVDRQQYKQLSINHWKMGIAAELARAAAWGTSAEYNQAAFVVGSWLKSEQQAWWLNEQAVGGSHAGYHSQAELLALAGANEKGDGKLAALLTGQIRRGYAVAAATATPNGLVCCVGERQEGGGPELPHLSALHRIANRLPHQGALEAHPEALTRDTFWLNARLATAMAVHGELPGPMLGAPLPPMRRKLTVYRWPGGHLTVMAADKDSPQSWAWCEHGTAERGEGRGNHATDADYTGKRAMPEPPHGAKVAA